MNCIVDELSNVKMARSDKFRICDQVAVAFVNPYRSNVE